MVTFKTKSGKKVSFKAGRKRRTRKLSAYNRFMARALKKSTAKSPTAAMRAAAKAWRKSKKKA